MPIYDYALIALLTSGVPAPAGVNLTTGPQAIAQPNGGLVLFVAKKAGQDQNTPSVKPKTAAAKGKSGTTKSSTKPFIKIEGVDGEAKDKDHKDWIEQN